MTTSLLVLGGSGFVGRTLVEEGLARGWEVATFNRGRGPAADQHVRRLIGDRLEPATLAQLGKRDWDLAADTWSGAPRAARDSATALSARTGRYVYISSGSVYEPPPPIGCTSPRRPWRPPQTRRTAPTRSSSGAPSSRSWTRSGNARCWRAQA